MGWVGGGGGRRMTRRPNKYWDHYVDSLFLWVKQTRLAGWGIVSLVSKWYSEFCPCYSVCFVSSVFPCSSAFRTIRRVLCYRHVCWYTTSMIGRFWKVTCFPLEPSAFHYLLWVILCLDYPRPQFQLLFNFPSAFFGVGVGVVSQGSWHYTLMILRFLPFSSGNTASKIGA